MSYISCFIPGAIKITEPVKVFTILLVLYSCLTLHPQPEFTTLTSQFPLQVDKLEVSDETRTKEAETNPQPLVMGKLFYLYLPSSYLSLSFPILSLYLSISFSLFSMFLSLSFLFASSMTLHESNSGPHFLLDPRLAIGYHQ